MPVPENTGQKQGGRFPKGKSGNPAGKPKGSRNKTTLAMEALLDGEADAIVRKAIEKAKDGEGIALRMCMERIVPLRRDRPVNFTLPPIKTAADALTAIGALVSAVAAGDITPSEAAELSKLIDGNVKSLEVTDLAERITKLERMITHEPAPR
jgi:Family of unknown function (DUF5681)